MRKLLRGLQRWWMGRRLSSGVTALSARLDALEERSKWRHTQLKTIETRLRSISEELMEDWEAERAERRVISTELAELERKFRTYSIEIDKLRAELGVSEETIKQLVAAHKLVLERADADVAIQVRRQVSHETQ